MSKSTKKKTPWLRLGIAAAATQGLYILMALLARDTQTHPPRLFEESAYFWALWTGLFILFATGVSAARTRGGKGVTLFIFITSFAFRATLITGEGFQTDTPTGWITESAASPLGQAVRSVAERLGVESPSAPALATRFLSTGADLAALALLPGLLKTAGLPPALSVTHGWNPLAIKESAAGGRLVCLALLLLVITARALQKKPRWRTAIAYGATLAAGLWTAACAPIMVRFLGASTSIAAALGVSAWAWMGLSRIDLAWAPYVGSSLLPATVSMAGVFLTRNPVYPAVVCFATWLLFVLLRAAQRPLEPEEIPRELLLATGGLLMVLPQVFPWYFVPVAVFSAFSGNRGWLVFTATAPITYLAYGNGDWGNWGFWLGVAQYFPAYFMLIFDWLGKKTT